MILSQLLSQTLFPNADLRHTDFFLHFFSRLPINLKMKWNLPSGRSHINPTAAREPAEAPLILSRSRWGAYCLKQMATPTWYIPRKPQPANDKFIFWFPQKMSVNISLIFQFFNLISFLIFPYFFLERVLFCTIWPDFKSSLMNCCFSHSLSLPQLKRRNHLILNRLSLVSNASFLVNGKCSTDQRLEWKSEVVWSATGGLSRQKRTVTLSVRQKCLY